MDTETVNEKSVRLFMKYLKLLKGDIAFNVLRLYYILRCRKLCIKENLSVPKAISSSKTMCSKCYTSYDNCLPYNRIRKEIKKNRFLKRVIKKAKNNSEMTPFQQKVSQKLQRDDYKFSTNCMLSICKTCHNKQNISLQKQLICDKLNTIPVIKPKVGKKRKRKDQLAGLKAEYVSSSNKSIVKSQKKALQSVPKRNIKKKKSIASKVKVMLNNFNYKQLHSLGDFLESLSK